MDKFRAMEAFVAVCEEGGFSAAALSLRRSKAQISKHVSALEDDLGVRLLNRTTRQHSLTEAGNDYLVRSKQTLLQVKESEEAIKAQADEPRGLLRVTAPIAFAHRRLLPTIEDFMCKYPQVTLHLELTNRYVDLVAEGYDLAIRVGGSSDGNFISKKLCETHHGFYASPAYLSERGTPKIFKDFEEHDSIQPQQRGQNFSWRIDGKAIQTKCVITTNDGDVMRAMALAGKGIITLPDFYVLEDLKAGNLVKLDMCIAREPEMVMALWPHRSYLPKKVRVFIDTLTEALKN